MLKILRITLREVALPLRRAFITSASSIARRRLVLIEVRLEGGVRVWGECVALEAPTYTPETVDGAWQILERWIAPQVLGREFPGPTQVHHHLSSVLRGHPMARAAVEMACWAGTAEILGKPLAALLGGSRRQVETGVALGLQGGLDALAERARQAKGDGYRRIRLKIGPDQDIAVV
ncbi:MAG: o-succinylbenzoate synthase, partial [Acidobacteria bacterium]|nr:o-succinylbenzoate synthase [Acidobacteriota bacterium]